LTTESCKSTWALRQIRWGEIGGKRAGSGRRVSAPPARTYRVLDVSPEPPGLPERGRPW
jgi:hypothetical protein